MTPHEQRAWDRLTADMAGDMHQYDYWQDVAEHVRQIYLDRILLEDAARAAGIELVWSSEPGWAPKLKSQRMQSWNPLTDDGEALRLAVQLDLIPSYMRFSDMHIKVYSGEEKTAETRRAIVRAAAALA